MNNKTIKINTKSKFQAKFRIDDRYVTDSKIMVNTFNGYFSNIDRYMAQLIIDPVKSNHNFLTS